MRVHGCIMHLEIRDGKVWIQYDGTEDGVALELVQRGIPRDQIVLAFKPQTVRKYTDYAFPIFRQTPYSAGFEFYPAPQGRYPLPDPFWLPGGARY